MPLPVLPGVVRVTAAGDCAGGGRWSNTWHARMIDLGEATDAELTTLATEFSTFYQTVHTVFCAPLTTVTSLEMTRLDGTSSGLSFTWAFVGADSTNETLPPECAGVLTVRTGMRGRQNRGRIFLPPVTTGGIAAGKFTSTYTTSCVGAAGTLNSEAHTNGWEIGVGSYGPYKNPITHIVDSTGGGTTAPHFTAATAFAMDTLVDVIRSRKN